MLSKRSLRVFLILAVIIINIGCDQVSKKMVRNSISYNESIGYFDNHLIITKVENTGAFLSLGNELSQSTKNILLAILPSVLLVFGFLYLLFGKKLSRTALIGFSFIIGGGVANIFDRIVYGSVTDFLYVHFDFFHTGVFNLADMSIVTGVLIVAIHSIFKKKYPVSENGNPAGHQL